MWKSSHFLNEKLHGENSLLPLKGMLCDPVLLQMSQLQLIWALSLAFKCCEIVIISIFCKYFKDISYNLFVFTSLAKFVPGISPLAGPTHTCWQPSAKVLFTGITLEQAWATAMKCQRLSLAVYVQCVTFWEAAVWLGGSMKQTSETCVSVFSL